MVTERELRDELDHALNCVLCFCGNHKRITKPFCFQCFDSLPPNWRTMLTQSLCYHPGGVLLPHEYSAAKDMLTKLRSLPFPSQDSAPLS